MDSTYAYGILPLAVLIVVCLWRYAKRAFLNFGTLPLPPGPKPLPIIGNVLDVPKDSDFPWLAYRKISETYGDVAYLRIFGQSIVIAGSREVAFDLLEKRSPIYSDRAQSVMNELIGCDWDLGFMPYGQRWREIRRTFHQHFNQRAVTKYQDVQLQENRRLLRHLLAKPDQFAHHIRFAFGATILKITYGIEQADNDDEYLLIAEKSTQSIIEGLMPGNPLVPIIALLRYIPSWVPGARFQAKLSKWKAASLAIRDVPFSSAKKDFVRIFYVFDALRWNAENMKHNGTAAPSIARKLFEENALRDAYEAAKVEEVSRDTLGIAFAVGADTTYSTMEWFFFAVLSHPEVQKKAQEELDAIVGPGRLPNFNDHDFLPYVNAVALECLRWQPVLPLGVGHRCMADDEYNGYLIPKGSIVIPNIWAFARDPEVYPEPGIFNPDRFLQHGRLNPEVTDPRTFVFGFGRRKCPGRHIAETSLVMNVASVLHVFDIGPPLDADGRPIQLEPTTTSGFMMYPAPFQCTIKPRSAAAEALICAMSDPVAPAA